MMERRSWGCLGLIACVGGLIANACLDRPLCSDCKPNTTNQFVMRIPTEGVDKLDLLFMVDASASMKDKQEYLTRAVPSLLARLLSPNCLDAMGRPTGEASQNGSCKNGTPEFSPVQDIHIGVISSSLGAFGGPCNEADDNDRAQLLPTQRPGSNLASWNNSGFLAWDPKQTLTPVGTRDQATLIGQFRDMISAVGENGCGYEASLESWYRFMVAPDPPLRTLVIDGLTAFEGVDQAVLQQRAAFLRPDSLVAVVMLTDENDCSMAPGTWPLTISEDSKARATSACDTNPNSACCRPCNYPETAPPAGCMALAQDPSCQPNQNTINAAQDHRNVRCWDQKRRFGIDMLENVSKYIDALTKTHVYARDGSLHPNPLFTDAQGNTTRERNLVYLAGIVGVPWQDIATPDSLRGSGLTYMTARELIEEKRWPLILGDPGTNTPPTDPHMIESVDPRQGTHPLVPAAALAPPNTTNPVADVIAGYERQLGDRDDLQYACIFELDNPKANTHPLDDCYKDGSGNGRGASAGALCTNPNGVTAPNTQYFAKAYPGRRQLEVLKGIGDQAIVASICPRVVRSSDPDTDPNFGYNPAVAALLKVLAPQLGGKCLARPPSLQKDGKTACAVLETRRDNQCNCGAAGRGTVSPDALARVREDMLREGLCDGLTGYACKDVCACSLSEVVEEGALNACRSTAGAETQRPGFCYVDPDAGLGDPALVRECPANKRRILRFVGENTPAKGSMTYMACFGETTQEPAISP